MDKKTIIETLCSKGHRGSTTPEEKWAAGWLRDFMEKAGLKAELLPFRGNPNYPQRMVVHLGPVVVLAFLIPALFMDDPVEGALPVVMGLLSLLIISYFVENVFLVDMFSRLTPKRESVNVLGRLADPGAKRRLLFVAHYDSQKEGALFDPKNLEKMEGISSPNSRITPVHLTFLAVAGLLPFPFLFAMELSDSLFFLVSFLYLGLVVWLTLSLAINLQWLFSKDFVPGANDNATGVAIMLEMAEKYAGEKKAGGFKDTELWFLATSCEETGLGGSLAFIRQQEKTLREKETVVLNLDGFGQGTVRYLTADGSLIARPYDRELVRLAEETARESFPDTTGFVCRLFTDGLAFTARGFRAISFFAIDPANLALHHYHWRTDTPENLNYEAVDRGQDFVEAYVERLVQGWT